MCTVTFLPLSDQGFVLTSNRDVGYQRKKASHPEIYEENGVSLYYPKDGQAGGTWIGTSRNNRLICLLNGGFKNHKRASHYPKSRGLIVKELLITENFEEAIMKIDLTNIEPFTLVVVSWEHDLKLYEFVWDGDQRYFQELDQGPRIWSSSTLFTQDMKKMREAWFEEWYLKGEINADSILTFHNKGGVGNPEVDVVLRRKKVGTVSITQVIKEKGKMELLYFPI